MEDRMNIANVFAPDKNNETKTSTHRTCKITNQPKIRETNEKNEDQIADTKPREINEMKTSKQLSSTKSEDLQKQHT